MRRLLTLTVLGIALALAGSVSAQTFVFNGHGYGHGVGMSQWGAEGFARNGWTYDRILAHYYSGTTLGPAPAQRIRVLLAKGRGSVAVSSQAPFTVVGANGNKAKLPAGSVTIGTDLALTIDGERRTFASPVRFVPGGKPMRFERDYRGSIVVHLVGGSLSVVNDVNLDEYTAAIVPHEMPPTWSIEALKVQAVAARTYAMVVRKPGTYFDFESNPVAQAYDGVEEEDARTTAAVMATKGQIVLYEGKPAWTFYSSSSGGRTASLSDSFPGGAQEYPYLVSVEDPYDGISPYHDWGPIPFTAEDLAAKLRLPGPPMKFKVVASPSGRVAVLVAKGPGWRKEVPGPTVRTSLGLRSTWFSVKKRREAPAPAASRAG